VTVGRGLEALAADAARAGARAADAEAEVKALRAQLGALPRE